MPSQPLTTLKKISSEKQLDYLKKQLEVSVLPHFFTYRQMFQQKIQSFALLLYMLGIFSSFIPFIPLEKEQSRWLFLGAVICYGILLLQSFISSSLKKYYLRPYQPEIEAHQYLATQGEILQIHVWNQKQKWLELTAEFQDISNDYIRKKFRIPYPQIEKFKSPLDPEQLIGQKVELCVLPQSYQLLQIRLLPTDKTKLEFFHSKSALFFSQNQLWSLHHQGIHIKSSVCTFTVQEIQFIRSTENSDFHLDFYCPEYCDFQIPSTIGNFSEFEQALFECFKDIEFDHYQKLKYSNQPQHIKIWQCQPALLPTLEKRKVIKDFELSLGLIFIITIVIVFILIFSAHHFIGLSLLFFAIVALISIYFYNLSSKRLFDYHQDAQL